MYRKWSTLVLLTLATPLMALAQNTGKLTGRVTDAATGEGLPGAQVTVEGTQLGAATDVDGDYTILGVPVGLYSIRASYIDYQPGLVRNVEINSGYTREINFALRVSAETEEVIVEYERPIIQKDALGAPRVVTGAEIQNLPVRGVANVASLQAGIVSNEGSGTLNVRGGRGADVTYYVDGVKVVGTLGVSQQAIAEQEMLIGGLPAKYGDALGGVISVTTKNGSTNFFGTAEAVTSQALDAYGYTSAQLAVGGPIVGSRLGFFVAGEYLTYGDQTPQAIGLPLLSESRFNEIQAAPQAFQVVDAQGKRTFRPIPGDLAAGLTLGQLQTAALQQGDSLLSINLVNVADMLTADDFSTRSKKPNNELNGLNFSGKINFAPVNQVRVVAGGAFNNRASDGFSRARSLFDYNQNGRNESQTGRGYLTWSHYLSDKTFYQIQGDYQDSRSWSFDRDFGRDVNDVIFYGDFDDASNAAARAYKQVRDTRRNRALLSPDSVFYDYQFSDRSGPSSVSNLYTAPGSLGVGYGKSRTEQLRFTANAQTQLGQHLLEFGGEYEQRTQRAFSIGGSALRFIATTYDDGSVEGPVTVSNYGAIDYTNLKGRTAYYGYNYNGTQEVDDESVADFATAKNPNIAPYKPIYYAGYIQDKIEYRDLVVQLGMRMDVYDSNQRVLVDPYSLSPIQRAGDLGLSNGLIGSDFAVYYRGNDVAGYRDLNGLFYDTNGQVVAPNAVITNSAVKPRLADGAQPGSLDERAFRDYKPQAIFQPRIGVTFPVTDQALFFAHYDVLAQRPTVNQFANLANYDDRLQGSGAIGNPDLKPERTTEYEIGFRQRLGEKAAMTLSGFYKNIDNLIQLRALKNTFPNNYSTYRNVDFGTVKGVEFEFDLRRTAGVSLNANYTLSFAQGTGSDANTTGNIFWLREANPFVPNFISPLDFDRRHTANLAVDYRLGANEGPTVFGAKVFENFGVNVLTRFKSGQPYSRLLAPYAIDSPVRLTGLQGEINGQTLPSTTLIDLKVDRRFQLSQGTALTAYLEVENLLDVDNETDVYQATGLANDDGYLDTESGLQERPIGSSGREYYRFNLRNPGNYGIPRQTRLGFRFNF